MNKPTNPLLPHIIAWGLLLMAALMAGGMHAYAQTLPPPAGMWLSLVAAGFLAFTVMLTAVWLKIMIPEVWANND